MRGSVNLVRVWVPMTAGVLALVGMSLGSPSAVRADDEMKWRSRSRTGDTTSRATRRPAR